MITALCHIVVAVYSAPLTRVHIDTDTISDTPQFVYFSDTSTGGLQFTIHGEAVQDIFQLERAFGFGVQATAAVGASQQKLTTRRASAEADGVLYGGQLRVYQEVVSIAMAGRPFALTLFVNARFTHTGGSSDDVSISQTAWTGGSGFMAEIPVGGHVSILPYAWFSPQLARHKDVRLAGEADDAVNIGFSTTRPLRAGLDVWIYPKGLGSTDHFAASFITSFIDTSGNKAHETSIVAGYPSEGAVTAAQRNTRQAATITDALIRRDVRRRTTRGRHDPQNRPEAVRRSACNRIDRSRRKHIARQKHKARSAELRRTRRAKRLRSWFRCACQRASVRSRARARRLLVAKSIRVMQWSVCRCRPRQSLC